MSDAGKRPAAADDTAEQIARLERRAARERAARKEAEQLLEAKSRELWEERERYRMLIENSVDVVATADMAGLITWITDSVTTMLGWTPAQLVGTSIASLLHPDDLPIYYGLRRQLDRGEDLRYEARMRAADGRSPWVSIQSRQVVDDRGRPSHRIAGWRDVTAEREARDALTESREVMFASAEGMLDPQVLCAAVRDQTGRIVDFTYLTANRAARQHFDMGEELIGATMVATLPAMVESGLLEAYALVVETGEPFSGDDVWFRDDRLDKQAYYDIRANAVTGDRLSLSWRNVTARHEAAQRIADSEERLRATLDSMLDPHVVLEAVRDDTGRIVDFVFTDANAAAAEFNGMSRTELIGLPLLGQHPAAGTTTLFDDYVHIVETGEPIIRDDWVYPQDMLGGEIRRYDVRAVKFRDGLSQTWRDVTDRYEATQRVAESEERFRLLADNSTDVIFRLRHSHIIWVSPSVSTVLGGSPQDWIGQSWMDLIHPKDMDAAVAALPTLAETGTGLYRARIRAADGSYHWAEAHIGTYVRSGGQPDGWIVSTRVIDEQVAAERKLERLARLDALTGAVNRGEAMARLGTILTHERHPGRDLAVIFCDVDRFKDINDTYGHATGDAVLVELAQRISDTVRPEDLVARMGGDEILVLLADTQGRDEAVQVAEKIRQRVATPLAVGGRTLTVTLSIGVSLLAEGDDSDGLIARADEAMYEAKRLGRDRVIAL